MNNKTLAIIPARGGSKRIPNKNITPLLGEPLISWTIKATIHSKLICKVIVSTDCARIASIAKNYGAHVPFLRSEALSTDTSTTQSVINDIFNREEFKDYDQFIILQPTSPLRTTQHINAALELLNNKGVEGVVSVCKTEHNPLWSNTLAADNSMNNFINASILNKRSQDLPQFYRLNGAIYAYKTASFIKNKGVFYNNKVFAYEMPCKDSIDIDEQLDLDLAEFLLQKRNNKKV